MDNIFGIFMVVTLIIVVFYLLGTIIFIELNSHRKKKPKELKVGQKFIGKLDNEHKGEVITITKKQLDGDNYETILHFLHYYGFEKLDNK